MSKNALIFAGAGASKAVNPSEYPTTLEFFEKLPQEILDVSLFNDAVNFVRAQKDDEIVDIEEVLWTLQDLLKFCTTYSRKNTFSGFMLHANRLIRPLGAGHNLGHLDAAVRQTRPSTLVFVVNPVKPDMMPERGKVEHIKAGFDKASVAELLANL